MAHSIELEQKRAHGIAMIAEIVRTMRPKDWIKNVFVFGAIMFSEQKLWKFWQVPTPGPIPLLKVLAAFVLFSMVAGAIYIINDLVDIEKDRVHPKKRHRPLASGRLSPGVARVAAAVLLTVALPAAFWVDQVNYDFGWLLIAYLLVQGIAYSYYLKNIVLLDIFTIAAGFVMRAVAGALVIDILITPWLLICMGLLALFLGLAKRRAELVLLESGAGSHRRILEEYSVGMLDQMMSIVTSAAIIAYTLFTTISETVPRHPFPLLLVTAPLVTYAIFRYLYLIHKQGGGGNPAELVLRDRPLAVTVVLWGLTALVILALAPQV